jgi:hypothetical protein
MTTAGALLATPAPVGAATTKNYSIFFMNGSSAVTGTLKSGTFTQKHSLTLNKHWDLAAASRTSLLLYNKTTGLTQTGTFLSGTYTKLHTYTLPTGYQVMTASCDTFLMWRPSDGRAITATLVNGALGTRHTSTIRATYGAYNNAAASCDSYILAVNQANGKSAYLYGRLKGGTQTPNAADISSAFDHSIVAMTDASWLVYSANVAGHFAQTGTISTGQVTYTGSTPGFSAFDKVAGTADSVLFYNSTTGSEARATLVYGLYGYIGGATDFSTGWKVIVGAK